MGGVPVFTIGVFRLWVVWAQQRDLSFYIFDQEMTSKTVGNHLPREMPEIPKCVEEERYDPWMLVERKQKRGTRLVLAKSIKATTASESNVSRFEFLSENLGDDSSDFAQDVNVEDADQTFKTQIEEDMREKITKWQTDVNTKVRNRGMNKSINKGKGLMLEGGLKATGPKLNGEKHLAVAFPSSQRPNEKVGREVGENTRQKPPSLTINNEPPLSIIEAVEEIIHGLHSHMGESSRMVDDVVVGDASGLRTPTISKFLKEYNREFRLDFVALFEVRISGVRVEAVIAKLGFDYSFRVELVGFAGGIRLLWKEGSSVEVLKAYPQFIHVRIRDRRCRRPFLY
ncbi:hypothetical protein Gotri_021201, partial [Gossypium trilobum]|nr:hypothetical protein [Gossypium trilobum]